MRYRDLAGNPRTGTATSAGPLFNSVWLVDDDDRTYRVVSGNPVPTAKDPAKQKPFAGEHIEREYTQPMPPPPIIHIDLLRKSEDVLRRVWRSAVYRDPYMRRVVGGPRDSEIVPPAEAEVALAKSVIELARLRESFDRTNREEHRNARSPLAEKKLLELLREGIEQ